MLPEPRRRLVAIERRLRHSQRISDQLQWPQGVLDLDDHVASLDLGIGEHVRDLVDRAAHDARRLQLLEPGSLGRAAEYLFKQRDQDAPIADASTIRHETLVVDPFWMSD